MSADRSPGARVARRRFLGALAVAPAALAGCATTVAAGGAAAAPAGASKGVPAPAPAPDAATRAVRDQPLAADAQPAFVFRAGSVRLGEP